MYQFKSIFLKSIFIISIAYSAVFGARTEYSTMPELEYVKKLPCIGKKNPERSLYLFKIIHPSIDRKTSLNLFLENEKGRSFHFKHPAVKKNTRETFCVLKIKPGRYTMKYLSMTVKDFTIAVRNLVKVNDEKGLYEVSRGISTAPRPVLNVGESGKLRVAGTLNMMDSFVKFSTGNEIPDEIRKLYPELDFSKLESQPVVIR